MRAEPHHRLEPQEYLAIEREAEEKHEYWDGDLVAISSPRSKTSR
jgi:hypothetical protein